MGGRETLRKRALLLAMGLGRRQEGVVTRGQLERLGLSASQIRWLADSLRVQRTLPGVLRFAGSAASWTQEVRSAGLWLGLRGAVSHRSAARLHGLEGCRSTAVELATDQNLASPRSNVVLHRVTLLDGCDLTRVAELRVTNPTRTLIDLAGEVSFRELQLALDDALRRRLSSVIKLRRCLDRLGRQGRDGARQLERLLEDRLPREPPLESVLEARALEVLRRGRLPRPHPQHQIVDERGHFVARVDFAYVHERIAIEVDGYAYHSSRRELARDAARSNALQALGWVVLRFTASTLEAPAQALSGLRRLLELRRSERASPGPEH